VAAFAFSAVVSASASAVLPEFSGTFPTSIKKAVFTKEAKLETKSGSTVKCTSFEVTGTLKAAKELESTIAFKGCTASFGAKCTNTANPEEIKVTAGGIPVYYEKLSKEVGIRALPRELGNQYTEFTCAGISKVKVRANAALGGLLCSITPVNTSTTKYTLTCNGSAIKGVNEITEYENEKGEKVKSFLESSVGGGAFEQSAEITGAVNFEFEKAVTLKA
jgi:hypothetical protein